MIVGFIGLGTMGRNAALSVRRAGFDMVVHDIRREAGERYALGAGERTVGKIIEDDAGIDLRVAGDWTKPWEVKHPGEG